MDIYIDFKCPASYLAFGPTQALVNDLATSVAWKPFRSRQGPVPAEKAEETRGETHRRVRAIQRREIHRRYAAVQGVPMVFRADAGETDGALSALLAPLPNVEEYIAAAFKAYWQDGADLSDRETVRGLLDATGNAPVIPEWEASVDSFEAYQTSAEANGVFFTPTYLVGDQIFVGREHLPWIGALLRGAT